MLFGLVTRRDRWGLSWRGYGLLLVVLLLVVLVILFLLYPFLAITARVDTKILVVEGWVPEFAVNAAVNEFRSGSYTIIYTTGGPVTGMGGYTNDYNTSASVAAGRLKAAGLSSETIMMVPARVTERDRTFAAARALRNWLLDHGPLPASINVLTAEAHSRRTRFLFQKAFGRDVSVGVISVANPDYDPHLWWKYSEGVREVLSEAIAYLYAVVFFHPHADQLSSAVGKG